MRVEDTDKVNRGRTVDVEVVAHFFLYPLSIEGVNCQYFGSYGFSELCIKC